MTWFTAGVGVTLVASVIGLMYWLVRRAYNQGRAEAVRDAALDGVDQARQAAAMRERTEGLTDDQLDQGLKRWMPPPG